MPKITIALWASSLLLVGCANTSGDPSPCVPACNPPMICDPNSHSCVPASGCHPPHENCSGQCVDLQVDASHCGSCGNSCGPNAQCSDGQCVCFTTFHNCNQTFSDGCECGTNCDEQQRCVVHGVTCDPTVAGDCSIDKACDRVINECVACPAGWENCDRTGDCECSGTCVGNDCLDQKTCDPDRSADCGDASRYCYPVTKICKSCPEGTNNCDLVGECECEGFCTIGSSSCSSCDPLLIGACNAYGSAATVFCSVIDTVCKPCPAGRQNCTGVGPCECFGTCTGTPPVCEPSS